MADALADTRVVLVIGARQCGKSTLVRLQARDSSAEWRNLDSAVTRQAAASDPTGFVDFGGLMVIDEIQRVPELLLAIKEQVDADPRPGRYVDWLRPGTRASGLPDTLPGRTETVELWPFSQNVSSRAIGTPKVAFVDSGVAGNLLDADARSLLRPGGPFGPLLEGFVLMELARQLTWSRRRVELSHYRTKDGTEVDAVLEDRQGRVVGIKVKASSTVQSDDFRGLRHLADRLGEDFVAGLVLYTGTQTLNAT